MEYVPSESRFEPCSQRYGLFLVCGCCTKFGASGGLFGPFPGHMVQFKGRKGLVDTGKSSRTWSVPTLSLCLAVLNGFQGYFGPKMAVLGPKLQFLKLRSATCDTRSRPPALSFWLIICVVVPHSHRYHPPKFQPNPKHHDGILIFAISRVLLAACCCLGLLYYETLMKGGPEMESFIFQEWYSHAPRSKGVPHNNHACILRETALAATFCNTSTISSVPHIWNMHHCTS